jgi:Ubiquitin-2 like Rad60 SUMO-like
MEKSKATTSARTKEKNGRTNDEEAFATAVAVAVAAPAKDSNKKRKASNESDNKGSIGKEAAAAEREETGDLPPRRRGGNAGDVEDDDDQRIWIRIPKRPEIFPVPDTWWMVDLHAHPAPKQGATPLVKRCMRELGWDEAKARDVLRAYRQFLSVKVAKRDWNAEILSPSVAVDQMWHQHLLDNSNYAHDCLLLCGRFMKHDPDGGLDVEARKIRLVATRQALLESFGDDDDEGEGGELDRSARGPWKDVFEGAAESDDDAGAGESDDDAGTAESDDDAGAGESDDDAGAGDSDDEEGTTRSAGPAEAREIDDDGGSVGAVTIDMRDDDGEVVSYRVRRTTRLQHLFAAYARRKGVEVDSLNFLLNGQRVEPHATPIVLQLEDGDQIDALVVRSGC